MTASLVTPASGPTGSAYPFAARKKKSGDETGS